MNIVKIHQWIAYPVALGLPPNILKVNGKIFRGTHVLMFHTAPLPGDTIEFEGHIWEVTRLAHKCQADTSTKPRDLPIVITEYIGAAA